MTEERTKRKITQRLGFCLNGCQYLPVDRRQFGYIILSVLQQSIQHVLFAQLFDILAFEFE